MTIKYLPVIFAFAMLGILPSSFAQGDADAGSKLFRKCKACHAIGEGAKNKTGPILTNIYGKKAGSVAGYNKNSKFMKTAGKKGLIWNDENLAYHLANPTQNLKTFLNNDAAKSKMSFKLKKPQEIKDMIAFLKAAADGGDSDMMKNNTGFDTAGHGNEPDIAYAKKLWEVSIAKKFAGPDRIITLPYRGHDPHGLLLENFYGSAVIDGHKGTLIMKTNYGPEGVTVDQVLANPNRHLGAYTLMFQREAGYDPKNGDWFWAEYGPDGKLLDALVNKPLAGRVGLCIDCHQAADGDDMMFMSSQKTC